MSQAQLAADAAPRSSDGDFVLSDRAFDTLRALVAQHAGIDLSDAKRQLVYRRIGRRLKVLGLGDFEAYCRYIESGHAAEIEEFVNAITTNLTGFFRENHHFEFLAQEALPKIRARNANTRRIRIWSAGCSTGEEPYSIAMTCRQAMPDIASWDIKILATDIDSSVLAHAQRGQYRVDAVEPVSAPQQKKYLRDLPGGELKEVGQELKSLITFKQLNLHAEWPMHGPFDLIFCRNVVIYFDKEMQRKLFDRYADILVPDGHVIIGHSESLFKITDRFKLLGRTVYQKCR